MLPSSTVENYLKAIHQGVARLPEGQRLMPMGQLAASLGVAPGTATTMVKTLAESGLAEYEPYTGVALTPAGRVVVGELLGLHGLDAREVRSRLDRIERLITSIQRQLETRGDEVPTSQIGEAVMDGLKAMDHVAYIRFASIYKDFSDPGDFAEIAERGCVGLGRFRHGTSWSRVSGVAQHGRCKAVGAGPGRRHRGGRRPAVAPPRGLRPLQGDDLRPHPRPGPDDVRPGLLSRAP